MLDSDSPVLPRLHLPSEGTACTPVSEVLARVRQEMGVVPNGIAMMANSPAVARAYLAFARELAAGALPARLRQQIALVVSEANHCRYCVSLHTALGTRAGLNPTEALSARRGFSMDAREREAMLFAVTVQARRGAVTDAELQRVRNAGYSDEEITEIAAHVALHLLTNSINRMAGTPIDFPLVPDLRRGRLRRALGSLGRIFSGLRASIRHEWTGQGEHVEN